jgi:hypothetical protein
MKMGNSALKNKNKFPVEFRFLGKIRRYGLKKMEGRREFILSHH